MVLGGLGTIARTCAMDADVDANGVGNGMAMGNGRKCLGRSGASLSGVSVFLKGRGEQPDFGQLLMGLERRWMFGWARVRNVFALNYSKIYSRRGSDASRGSKKVCPKFVPLCQCVCACENPHGRLHIRVRVCVCVREWWGSSSRLVWRTVL